MTGMMWRPWGQHWVETTETTAMETTWGPSGGYGDDVEMTGMTWGQRGQHGDHGDNGDNIGWRPQRQQRPQPWGPHGDLLGAMGMMWG